MIFTRMGNSAWKHLASCLDLKTWRGIKRDQPTLFYLNLSYNFFNWDGVKPLIKLFYEKLPVEFSIKNKLPLQCEIRILILDHNYIGSKGAEIIGEILPHTRSLSMLSLEMNRINGIGSEVFFEGLK